MTARLGAAPITWGVCEVPGWGYQLPAEQVLAEMRDIGVTATELGPEGFLPADPRARLAMYGLAPIGAFVPVVMHQPRFDPMPEIERAIAAHHAISCDVMVLAAVTGGDGYDRRPVLDASAWSHLLSTLDRAADAAEKQGVTAVIHPHVGTVVERANEVARVVDGSGIGICLDTGHLSIGGLDPEHLAEEVPERIAHVHLKDVDLSVAARVQAGDLTYTAAVRSGLYRPIGAGDVAIACIVARLAEAGYGGWYVLEQDTILESEAQAGEPKQAAAQSLGHVRELLAKATNKWSL